LSDTGTRVIVTFPKHRPPEGDMQTTLNQRDATEARDHSEPWTV